MDDVDEVDDVLVVRAREELVVLVELCSAAVSMSAAGATANPVAGVAAAVVVDVVLTELVVVVSFVTLFTPNVAAVAAAAAADLGTAVHRRPSMVVKKAPDGRPNDAIFNSQSLPDGRVRRGQSLRNEEKGKGGIQIHAQTGSEETKLRAARAV